MKKVLYVGKFVPNIGAAGIHVYNIAQCLKSQGVDVVYMAFRDSNVGSNEIIYDVSNLGRLKNLFDVCTGYYEFKLFKKVIELEQPDAVILYNKTNVFARKAISYCKSHNIRIIIENTEWYTLAPINCGLADFFLTRSVDRRIRYSDRCSDGVIAISSYLEQFYKGQGIRVFNLPPLFFYTQNNRKDSLNCDTIRFVYAGSPGGKDILKPFVKNISELRTSEGLNIEFHIYGINPIQLSDIMGNQDDYSQMGVFAHGHVSHDEVVDAVSQSHYTILLRYPERYAKAGYSTKVAESLSLGTPVICNRIGGTDLDIENGTNGFVIPDTDDNNLKGIIRTVCNIEADKYSTIRKKCIEYASMRYSPDTYAQKLFNFIFC